MFFSNKIMLILPLLMFTVVLSLTKNIMLGYAAILVISILSITFLIYKNIKLDKVDFNFLALAFVFFLIWLYGVLVGICYGVREIFVFSNFVGLSLYSVIMYFVVIKANFKDIVKTFNFLSLSIIFYAIWFIYKADSTIELSNYSSAKSMSDMRLGFDVIYLYLFPPLFYQTSIMLDESDNNKIIFSCLYISLLILFIIYPTLSKGYILALVIFMVYIFFCYFLRRFKQGKMSYVFVKIGLLISLIMIFIFVKYNDLIFLIIDSYSNKEVSNNIRSEQFDYLLQEISFFGMGLGSTLASGYVRSVTAPYGYELTYVNIMVKFGFLSVFILIAYIIPLIKVLMNILLGNNVHRSCFCLGCFTYMVPGAANPLLLSPSMIFLHCIGLYYLYKKAV